MRVVLSIKFTVQLYLKQGLPYNFGKWTIKEVDVAKVVFYAVKFGVKNKIVLWICTLCVTTILKRWLIFTLKKIQILYTSVLIFMDVADIALHIFLIEDVVIS